MYLSKLNSYPLVRSVIKFLALHSGEWTKQIYTNSSQIYRAAQESRSAKNPDELYDIVSRTPALYAQQKRWEIITFLEHLQNQRILRVCEIGTGTGGTLFLLMRSFDGEATFISIDIENPSKKRWPLRFAKKPDQKIHLIQGESNSRRMVAKVMKLLRGEEIDLLFIDGDHSYKAVKEDFELYGPLVCKGGIIALHDIVPDRLTTSGLRTNARSGDVHLFWHEIAKVSHTREIVESRNQDGYGIGIVHKK